MWILDDVESVLFSQLPQHVERLREDWDKDYNPDDYFDTLRTAINHFVDALAGRVDADKVRKLSESYIREAVNEMVDEFVPDKSITAPTQQSVAKADSLDELFRDVDE